MCIEIFIDLSAEYNSAFRVLATVFTHPKFFLTPLHFIETLCDRLELSGCDRLVSKI